MGSFARVSSQKQNREGVVGAQSGQYRATAESSPGCSGAGPRCDNLVSEPIPGRKCANEEIGPLRGVDCKIPHRPRV